MTNEAEQMDHRAEDVLCHIDNKGVASLTLNRPNKYNAFDDVIINQLLAHLQALADNPAIRCLILQANGKHFSAGADLSWMQSMANKSNDENQQDAHNLALLLHSLDNFPHPTLAVIQGSAFGGALGLICCCDMAIACQSARFCLSEVKLGLIPATIGPYVNRTIGTRQARRYMLTAETISANRALKLGIIHRQVEAHGLTRQPSTPISQFIDAILAHSPNALTQTKQLCARCYAHPIDDELVTHTSQLIADARASKQGKEGLRAFFDKRPPKWSSDE